VSRVAEHPLGELIVTAAGGRFLAADGSWRRVPPWRPGIEAVVAFTGHAVFAVQPDVPDRLLGELGADGFGGAHHPRLISALAGAGGWIDSLDMLLTAHGTGASPLVERPDLAAHPRAAFAASIRDPRRVMGYPDAGRSDLAVISTGIGGLTEISFELEPGRRGSGSGAGLVRDALGTVPDGEIAVAAVAPGNVASIRAALAAGFVPAGSIQLFSRERRAASRTG
jgi:hypothetical protein